MNVYFWMVLGDELGTATMSRRGRIEDFRPATITPSRVGATANLVTFLKSEVEYGPLGRLLLHIANGTLLSRFCVDAVPAGHFLLEKGAAWSRTYAPQFEIEWSRQASNEYFDASRLSRLNLNLNSPDFVQDITGWTPTGGRTFDVKLADLPTEVELVVTRERRYRHGTETFRTDGDLQVLGFHERSVAKIEAALQPGTGANPTFVKAVEHYKHYSTLRRAICGKLRIGIAEIMSRIREASADSGEFNAVLEWIGRNGSEEFEPKFLVDQLKALHATYAQPQTLCDEFAALRSDLIDAIRDFAMTLLSQNE